MPPPRGVAGVSDVGEFDLSVDAALLTAALVDVESVSGDEQRLADLGEAALLGLTGIAVERAGNVVLARTGRGRGPRMVLAGPVDAVPIAGNVPSHRAGGVLHGCGTTDMKSGV